MNKHRKTVPDMPIIPPPPPRKRGLSESPQTFCWLCRVIGHKWVTRRKYSVDDVSMSDTVLWGCCVRCGEPTPDRIMDATANAESEVSE